jgi:hypothetical protein
MCGSLVLLGIAVENVGWFVPSFKTCKILATQISRRLFAC